MPIRAPEGYLDITNATLRASEIVTTSNVGIANANPTNTLSIGSNVFFEDTSSNAMTVRGNVVAEGIKLGFLQLLPSYDLELTANVGNSISNTVQFTNSTTGFVTSSNVGIGTNAPDGLVDVGTVFKVKFGDSGATAADIITGYNSVGITESGGTYTYTRDTAANYGNFLPSTASYSPITGRRYRIKLTARSDFTGSIRLENPANGTVIASYDLTTSFTPYEWEFTATATTMYFRATITTGTTLQFNAFSMEVLEATANTDIIMGGTRFIKAHDASKNFVAIGPSAGATAQGNDTVAVGYRAGYSAQGTYAVAVGDIAGRYNQGSYAVAMGREAGTTSQGSSATAVGYRAGLTSQGNSATALGVEAGKYNQGSATVAVGYQAGETSQGTQSVAMGVVAARYNQGTQSVAVGREAGFSAQGNQAIAVGYGAGQYSQGNQAVAMGFTAGLSNQGTRTVAVGYQAGKTSQGGDAVAVGYAAGQNYQGVDAIAIGNEAGQNNQEAYAVSIGNSAGDTSQGNNAVAVGRTAGNLAQGTNAVAAGYEAGFHNQGVDAIAIGRATARYNQSAEAIAMGYTAGDISQGSYAVAVGHQAGYSAQGSNAVAMGRSTGLTSQSDSAVAVGYAAGNTNQGSYATALGREAGQASQGAYAVAAGYTAGYTSQGGNTVAVGNAAGQTSQGYLAVAMGYRAGTDTQGTSTTAVGQEAGRSNQGTSATAVGHAAGMDSQGNYATAAGYIAGQYNQGVSAVAVGDEAGRYNQGVAATAVGQNAGQTSQSAYATALGIQAGQSAQGSFTVAVGYNAATDTQGERATALGNSAGRHNQGLYAVAVGDFTASVYQGTQAVAVGQSAGQTSQGSQAVAVGQNAGQTSQAHNATAVGRDAGRYNQLRYAVAVGINAGHTSQGVSAVAVGNAAGYSAQADNSTAVGVVAGAYNQGGEAVAVGRSAGRNNQGGYATALGPYAGESNQGAYAVAVGRDAGLTSQGTYATAAGYLAAQTSQGDYAIALGYLAGRYNQPANSTYFRYDSIRGLSGTRYDLFVGTTGEFQKNTSDDRLKHDEKFITGAVKSLSKLRPQEYLKRQKLDAADPEQSWSYEAGLMAQEVYYSAPELRHIVQIPPEAGDIDSYTPPPSDDPTQDPDYSAWGNDVSTIEYKQLTPYLVKAVQEIVTELPRSKTTVSNAWGQNIVGLVVSANANAHKTDATPIVALSNVYMDKKWYGVVSNKTTDTNDYDTLVDTKGDTQIWVTDTGGPIESGDLVTTSNVAPGYAQKQGDGVLMNYTVAKVTQDCDFTEPAQRPIRVPKRELSNVTYYRHDASYEIDLEKYENVPTFKTRVDETTIYFKEVTRDSNIYTETRYYEGDVEVSRIKYDTLPEDSRSIKHLSEISVDDYEALDDEAKATYSIGIKKRYFMLNYSMSKTQIPQHDEEVVVEELVDVLDENGQIVWEETGETEPVYTLVDHGTYKAALVSAKLV
jgi:hypothetical protein